MDTLLIIGAVAAVLVIGYLILRKPKAETTSQAQANETIRTHLKSSGHGSISRRNGRYVYDDGSFIEDLILLDILMDGELDFNFIPEYDEGYDAEANAAIFAEVDTILPVEQTFEKGDGGMEYRDTPEAAVETTPVETTRSFSGGDSGYSSSDSGGYGGGDSGGGDSGGSSDD